MDTLEVGKAIRDSFDAGDFGDASVYISEVELIEGVPVLNGSYATFEVHKGGLACEVFHVLVYKEVVEFRS